MGYSTGWHSWWRILKQHICIWQFFISVLLAMPSALPAPCLASGLSWWAHKHVQPFVGLICGSQIVAQPYVIFLLAWSLDFTDLREDLCIHLFLERGQCMPILYTSIPPHTHTTYFPFSLTPTYALALSPSSPSRAGLGTQVRKMWLPDSALPCLIWAAAARAGAWTGHKATGTTMSPIWSHFHYWLAFAPLIFCFWRQQIGSGRSCPGISWQIILFAFPKP